MLNMEEPTLGNSAQKELKPGANHSPKTTRRVTEFGAERVKTRCSSWPKPTRRVT